MKSAETLNVTCLYCDDVRHESSGKMTLVGVYPGAPVQYPDEGVLLLPKLCVVATLTSPTARKLSSLRCELTLDGEVIHGLEVPSAVLQSEPPEPPGARGTRMQLIMELGNIPLSQPGILRFSAIADGDERHECHGVRFSRIADVPPSSPEQ